jgi:hypothetical protein
LQHAESEGIYRRSVLLLENFFGADGENEPPIQVPISTVAWKLQGSYFGTNQFQIM